MGFRRAPGFTLAELLVATACMGLLLAGMAALYGACLRGWRRLDRELAVQRALRLALVRLAQDLRLVGQRFPAGGLEETAAPGPAWLLEAGAEGAPDAFSVLLDLPLEARAELAGGSPASLLLRADIRVPLDAGDRALVLAAPWAQAVLGAPARLRRRAAVPVAVRAWCRGAAWPPGPDGPAGPPWDEPSRGPFGGSGGGPRDGSGNGPGTEPGTEQGDEPGTEQGTQPWTEQGTEQGTEQATKQRGGLGGKPGESAPGTPLGALPLPWPVGPGTPGAPVLLLRPGRRVRYAVLPRALDKRRAIPCLVRFEAAGGGAGTGGEVVAEHVTAFRVRPWPEPAAGAPALVRVELALRLPGAEADRRAVLEVAPRHPAPGAVPAGALP